MDNKNHVWNHHPEYDMDFNMDFNWGQPHGPMAPQLQAVTKPPMVKRPWEWGPIILSLLKDAPPILSLSMYILCIYKYIYRFPK